MQRQDRERKMAMYPVCPDMNTVALGEIYEKGQHIEIKSILGVVKRKHAWGGGSGSAIRGSGPKWVDAEIEGMYRGGGGNYDVYVPYSQEAKSSRMAGVHYSRVPASCLRPRRRRAPFRSMSTSIHIPTRSASRSRSAVAKLPSQLRQEASISATQMRTQARARASEEARKKAARRARAIKRASRIGTKNKNKSSKAQKQRRTLRKMLEDLHLDLSQAPQFSKAQKSQSSRSGLRGSTRMYKPPAQHGRTTRSSPESSRWVHPKKGQYLGTVDLDITMAPVVKDYDWFATWSAMDKLDANSKAMILPQSQSGCEAFDLPASHEREKGAILRLWSILQVPRSICKKQRMRLFGKPLTQRKYATVVQQASWLRQCLAKLLTALRTIDRREKLSRNLGAVIQDDVFGICKNDEGSTGKSGRNMWKSDELKSAVKQLVLVDAECSAAILNWTNVSPWVDAGKFKYRGERYLKKIEKETRFLETMFHVIAKSTPTTVK